MARGSAAAKPPPEPSRVRLFSRPEKRVGNFAMIIPVKARASTAALQKVADRPRTAQLRPDLEWQRLSYDMVELVAEVGFVTHLKANVGAMCPLVPQEMNAEGDWENTEDERALRVDAAFVGPQGGQTELKRRAFLHMEAAGESYLVASPTDDVSVSGQPGLFWEFLSVDEIRPGPAGEGVVRRRDGLTDEALPDESYVARMWRSHYRWSDRADSALKRVLTICQEIVTLTQMIDAVLKSRLSAGILFVPDEMSFTDEAVDELEVADGLDAFTERLMKHMSTPIMDRTSAAALVPLVLRGPGDMGDKIRLIDVARALDTYGQELRQEALTRLSHGLDVPPEVMTGKASLSGLGGGNVAQSIDEAFVTQHIVPPGGLLADFATAAFLRPMLEEYEGLTVEQASRFRYQFDPSPILGDGDVAAAARALHDAMVVSDETLLRANKFGEADRPDPAELYVRQAMKLIIASPTTFAKALLPTLPGFEKVNPEDLAATPPAPPPVPDEKDAPAGGEDAPPAPPAPPGQPAEPAKPAPVAVAASAGAGFAVVAGMVAAAADAALDRAVERASSRVCTAASKVPGLKDKIRDVPKETTLTLLSPGDLTTLGLTADRLLDGAWDAFAARARGWVRAELEQQGASSFVADDTAALAVARLCVALNAYVVENLHLGFRVGDNGMRVPSSLVNEYLCAVVGAPVGA